MLGSALLCVGRASKKPGVIHFWCRIQVELLDWNRWKSRVELVTVMFDYLKVFHNRQRHHSALGIMSPIEFEVRPMPTKAAGVQSFNSTKFGASRIRRG
jgi:hypothetical protein